MKITDKAADNSDRYKCSDLVAAYQLADLDGVSLEDFIRGFEWSSRDDIANGIRYLVRSVCKDKHLLRITSVKKSDEDYDSDLYLFFQRHYKIASDSTKWSKGVNAIADSIWEGGYARGLMHDRIVRMFHVEHSAEIFRAACERIKSIYSLSSLDIEKLHFFVEMVKAEKDFPPSLRRMLYIYGTAKKTGKTTVASMLSCFLNGDEWSVENAAAYKTELSRELQIGDFKLPAIASCNCAVLDECFYQDMGKTYADFKARMTSNDGKARLPYGQTFGWSGCPNYIATSNDPLTKFIKDWDDRRFLSVEFRAKPTESLDFSDIAALWRNFCVHSERVRGWSEWADAMFDDTVEKGELQQDADDLADEMRKTAFLTRIVERPVSATNSNDDRYCVKNIKMDLVAAGALTQADITGNKINDRVRKAMAQVFGEPRPKLNDWRLSEVRKKADEIMRGGNAEPKAENKTEYDGQLPF